MAWQQHENHYHHRHIRCNLWKHLKSFTSFQTTDPDKLKLIYTLHGNRFDCLTKVILPINFPAILSILKVDIGLCLIGVVIGEFLAARKGLGYLIIYGSQVFP